LTGRFETDSQPEALERLRRATSALQPDAFAELTAHTWRGAVNTARERLYAQYTEQRSTARDEQRDYWKSAVAEQRTAANTLTGAVKNNGQRASRDVRVQAWTAIKQESKATVETLKTTPKPLSFNDWLTAQSRTDPTARVVSAALAEQRERNAAAAARIADDRTKIAAVLATHPHPDAADRDPELRERREELEIRNEYTAARAADAITASTAAQAAFKNLSPGTWLRNVVLSNATALQQKTIDAAHYAERNENTRPDDGTLRTARDRGRLLALGARDRTAVWEARPDVAQAQEQARLNEAVDTAAHENDRAITRLLRAGDPDGARQIILDREEIERRATAELERRQGVQPTDGTTRPGSKIPR